MRALGAILIVIGLIVVGAGGAQQITVDGRLNFYGAHIQTVLLVSGLLVVLIGAVFWVGGAIVRAVRRLEPPRARDQAEPPRTQDDLETPLPGALVADRRDRQSRRF
jgi:drug/metabolite transporter (DMT)-like permease